MIPPLVFTPASWAKLVYLRDAGPTEIAAMGLSSLADPLRVEDLLVVKQSADWADVAFDDTAIAELFDQQVDAGRHPAEFGRIWLHTHPGSSAQPSAVDEETFERVFGGCDWSVMFILAKRDRSYARLQIGTNPKCQVRLGVEIDWQCEFAAADHGAWQAEYDASVRLPVRERHTPKRVSSDWDDFDAWVWEPVVNDDSLRMPERGLQHAEW